MHGKCPVKFGRVWQNFPENKSTILFLVHMSLSMKKKVVSGAMEINSIPSKGNLASHNLDFVALNHLLHALHPSRAYHMVCWGLSHVQKRKKAVHRMQSKSKLHQTSQDKNWIQRNYTTTAGSGDWRGRRLNIYGADNFHKKCHVNQNRLHGRRVRNWLQRT